MSSETRAEILKMTLYATFVRGMQAGAHAVLEGLEKGQEEKTADLEVFPKHIQPLLDLAVEEFEAILENPDGNIERTTI